MTFDTVIASLKQGEFVMVYDSDGRESEVDMMVAAEFITPEHVARMRQHAGGLLCLAISNDLTKKGLDMSKSLNKIKATIIYLNSKGIYKIETIKPATSSITTSFGSLLLK